MIEAQSRYLNALVGEVIRAHQKGLSLSLKPAPGPLKKFNDRIQALLQSSSFADPKCNSWYKTKDGLITNNWSGTVIDYQQELSAVEWQDYDLEGSAKDLVLAKKATRLGRVREELLVSNTSLLAGALSISALAGYFLARPLLLKAR